MVRYGKFEMRSIKRVFTSHISTVSMISLLPSWCLSHEICQLSRLMWKWNLKIQRITVAFSCFTLSDPQVFHHWIISIFCHKVFPTQCSMYLSLLGPCVILFTSSGDGLEQENLVCWELLRACFRSHSYSQWC
jgi:hypothetical protein